MGNYLDSFYFAYGSNLNLQQMKERCPKSIPIVRAKLENHKLVFRANKRGVGVADVLYSIGDCVEGGLYKITQTNLDELDKKEGHPHIYERQIMPVRAGKEQIYAILYKMDESFDFSSPEEPYFEKILEGYRNWAISSEGLYLAKDEY